MLEDLIQQKASLAEAIRNWCKGQVELWQQIPYLALMANSSPNNRADSSELAYKWGLWNTTPGGTYVDLSTGNLVYDPESLKPATIDRVLGIHLPHLDPVAAIARLQAGRISPAHDWYAYEREAMRAKFGLAPDKPYRRLVSIRIDRVYGDYNG